VQIAQSRNLDCVPKSMLDYSEVLFSDTEAPDADSFTCEGISRGLCHNFHSNTREGLRGVSGLFCVCCVCVVDPASFAMMPSAPCLFLSTPCLLSCGTCGTAIIGSTVPFTAAATDPVEWIGDPLVHTVRVLPTGSKGWTCKACGDRAVWCVILFFCCVIFLVFIGIV
jgi:hypothetical protein